MVGDWNYVTDELDYITDAGPTEPESHPKSIKFLMDRGMVDIFRHKHLIDVAFTHQQGHTLTRLDRFYVSGNLTLDCDSLDMIPTGTICDHNSVGLSFGDTEEREEIINGYYRMSQSLVFLLGCEHSRVKIETEAMLAAYVNIYHRLQAKYPGEPVHAVWNRFKDRIRDMYRDLDVKYTKKKRAGQARKTALPKINTVKLMEDPEVYIESKIKESVEYEQKLRKEMQNSEVNSQFRHLRDMEKCNKLFSDD